MANQNARGWRRIARAFGYSMQGFHACGETPLERAMLIGGLLMIPIVELLNSAIEANVDRVGPEHHELSARAKDIASAAVFLSVVFAWVVWGLILVPKWI